MEKAVFDLDANGFDDRPEISAIFKALKNKLPELKKLLEENSNHWGCEDGIYRFYHHSFKVYRLQGSTLKIVEVLQALSPGRPLNETFLAIVKDGTEKAWSQETNEKWDAEARPILEAFFHAKYFLEMAVKYGEQLEFPPNRLPSGWAAVLYLYNLR